MKRCQQAAWHVALGTCQRPVPAESYHAGMGLRTPMCHPEQGQPGAEEISLGSEKH